MTDPADRPATDRLLELRALCAGPDGADPEALIMAERRSVLVMLDELVELRQAVLPQQAGGEDALVISVAQAIQTASLGGDNLGGCIYADDRCGDDAVTGLATVMALCMVAARAAIAAVRAHRPAIVRLSISAEAAAWLAYQLAIEEAARAAGQAAHLHLGHDGYSKAMDDAAVRQVRACVDAIRALIPAPPAGAEP